MAPLNSYADVQALLDTFVANNNVPINLAPHRAFWKTMTYQEFITGNIPRVEDPDTGNPLKVLVVNDSKNSNLIMSLSGTPGTIFDPNTGSIGQMPPSGPFMDPADIARIADWIDRGCPNN
ncbi:hypothetical protein G5S37_12135 [Roseimicrobium sp. ORNL1]|nr:hypothetical protein G5S37_12135 [Roseimicrobium sp. ORNL1]